MEETNELIEIPEFNLIKVPEGYSKIIVDEAQIIIAISSVLAIRSLLSYLINKYKQSLAFLGRQNTWKLEREIKIKDIITEILFILKADRVILSHFVNGEMTVSGMPLKKIKITFEKTALGIASITSVFSDIPVNRILTQVQELIDRKDWVFCVTRLLPESSCRAHLSSVGVKSQAEKILIKNGMPVAILTIQFVREESNLTQQILTDKPEIQDLFSRLLLLV